jgi:FixJ family two-component response regulator
MDREVERHRLGGGVVLDLGLPRLSGRDVRRELASHLVTDKIPIVVVTGETGEVDPYEFPCVLSKR